MGKEKITLFLDVDDTVLHSSEAVVQIMNEKYGTNKTVKDVTDWGYRSICSGANFDNVNEIFASERFWDIVQIDPDFKRFYHDHKRHFNFVFVSKGIPLNLKRKETFLAKLDFIALATPSKSWWLMLRVLSKASLSGCPASLPPINSFTE